MTAIPPLVIATDVCLWVTLFAVAIGFGGRMANGQLALVIGASMTAFCWMIHQVTTSEPRYSWNGSEWLWCAGIMLAISQIVPLPTPLLLTIAPRIKDILPLWFDRSTADLFPAGWHQLSLAPWETTSGLATFVSYAMLFLVMSQRIRTIDDAEQTLCRVSLAAVAMMVFAQLQYLMSNGKFFWTIDYPFMSTYSYPLGCFTNRNHLAQFLALGTPALIWWLLRRLQTQNANRNSNRTVPWSLHMVSVGLLAASLTGIGLTILMTLSRGGLLALAIASFVAISLFCRLRLASLYFGLTVLVIITAMGGLFSLGKYEALMGSRLEQNSGRQEIWMANLRVAADFPVLGTGIGTHPDAYRLQMASSGPEFSHAESGYLQVASETGLAGLTLSILFIAISFRWCIVPLRSSDTNASSIAAVCLASLLANVIHAAFDFFWYTPTCMLLLALQLACAARIFRIERKTTGLEPFSLRLPRFVTAISLCGIGLLAVWMIDLKFPALIAEEHRLEAARIANTEVKDLSPSEQEAETQLRLQELILAGKSNPRDAKLQETAASAAIELFDLRQQKTENSMSSDALRDAVQSSGFESIQDANEWLVRVVGSNLKLLRLADRFLKRSLMNSPLRAKSYTLLIDLNFLRTIEKREGLSERILEQTLTLRPNDPDTQFLVGVSELQEGRVDRAIMAWRPAFQQSPQMQERISAMLAPQVSPEFFEEKFEPDWKTLAVISKSFAKAGRDEEARVVKRRYITLGMELAKSMMSEEDLESTLIMIRNACRELGDNRSSINALTYATKRLPHSYTIHYLLGLDLMSEGRASDAAEHLQWCVDRRPNDAGLRKTASIAIIEKLKESPKTNASEAAIQQTGLRN